MASLRLNRALEQRVLDLGGTKALYAHTYCTDNEFWAPYHRRSHDALHINCSVTYLLTVYDNVTVNVEA